MSIYFFLLGPSSHLLWELSSFRIPWYLPMLAGDNTWSPILLSLKLSWNPTFSLLQKLCLTLPFLLRPDPTHLKFRGEQTHLRERNTELPEDKCARSSLDFLKSFITPEGGFGITKTCSASVWSHDCQRSYSPHNSFHRHFTVMMGGGCCLFWFWTGIHFPLGCT